MSGGGSASDFILRVQNAALPSYPVWAAAAAATPAWPAAVATLHRGIACLCGPAFPGELGQPVKTLDSLLQPPTVMNYDYRGHQLPSHLGIKSAHSMLPCCGETPIPFCPPSGSVLYAAVSVPSREKRKTALLALSAGGSRYSSPSQAHFLGPESRTSRSNIFASLPLRWHPIGMFV